MHKVWIRTSCGFFVPQQRYFLLRRIHPLLQQENWRIDANSESNMIHHCRKAQALLFFARCRGFHVQQDRRLTADASIPTSGSQTAIVSAFTRDGNTSSTSAQELPTKSEPSEEHKDSCERERHVDRSKCEGPLLRGSFSQAAEGTVPSKTRAQSRLERRVRREHDGTYRRASKDATAPHDFGTSDVAALIQQIDKLEGPREQQAIALMAEDMNTSVKTKRAPTSPSVHRTKHNGNARAKPSQVDEEVVKPRKSIKAKSEKWQTQKQALEHKFGEKGWSPRKRLSPDTLEGIRALHASDPSTYSTQILADHFKVSPEAIRRILRSKWKPNHEEAADRSARWERRGAKKWQEMSAQGARPPSKWRAMGVGRTRREIGGRQARTKKSAESRVPVEWNGSEGKAALSRTLSVV